jgi:hypothetical protein
MPLKAKHIVEEINGIRCTIIEKSVASERCAFLKNLLEFNKFEVKVVEENKESEELPSFYTIGVTDLDFNPVIAVYELRLMTAAGKKVSPAYWDQQIQEPVDQYWLTPDEMKPGGSAWFYKE